MKHLKWLLLSVSFLAVPALADTPVTAYLGGNGGWFRHDARPSGIEAGGGVRAMFSRHLSAVGEAYYGFDPTFLRGNLGGMITTTDGTSRNLSLGTGMRYQTSNKPELRPNEWQVASYLGFRPAPDSWPKVSVGLEGAYGLETGEAELLAGLRWRLSFSDHGEY